MSKREQTNGNEPLRETMRSRTSERLRKEAKVPGGG